MQPKRRKQIRRNLLEMYRENAMRSQSYMDVIRLEKFLGVMWTKYADELNPPEVVAMENRYGRQLLLFAD